MTPTFRHHRTRSRVALSRALADTLHGGPGEAPVRFRARVEPVGEDACRVRVVSTGGTLFKLKGSQWEGAEAGLRGVLGLPREGTVRVKVRGVG